MEDCIFCKIIKGEIPSRTVYEDEIIKVIMNIYHTKKTLWKSFWYWSIYY